MNAVLFIKGKWGGGVIRISRTMVFNIDSNYMLLEQQISILEWFLEGSCDTEDWSNDAEILAVHHRNKLHFKIYLKKKV